MPQVARHTVTAHGVSAVIKFPDATDWISKMIAASGTFYERPLLDAIRALGRRGAYIDVGAHVGNHSVFFALCCPSTDIWSIESDPDTFKVLLENTRRLDKVHQVHAAAMESRGFVQSVKASADNTGMNYVRPASSGVLAAPLDELVPVDDPTVIKIDVEGSEVAVLRGAKRLLSHRPLLVVESRSPGDDAQIAAHMKEIRYQRGKRYCGTPTYFWWPMS